MSNQQTSTNKSSNSSHGFIAWLDHRTGVRNLAREALYEPIPGGARLAYVFGSGLLFILLSQIVTGVFLAMYYVPSADHAHTTIAYIAKAVTGGSFLRSLHSYGSSAMVITLVVHFTQTYFFGSYKGRREVLWLSGLTLFALVFGMAFTGYLLPWDQKAYFATTIGTNIAGEVPFVGDLLKKVMRGGAEMGTLTLSRFFVAHVFLIPACIFAFVSMHVFLFRKAGSAGPVTEDPVEPKLPLESFYPKQVLMDIAYSAIVITMLALMAYFWPTELGPKANPADTQFLPRPEWYYLPIFQWLKYWSGPYVVVGIIIIPILVILPLAFLPLFDRSHERRPWKRPIAIGSYLLIIGGLSFLGWQSLNDDATDPAVAKQLAKQTAETNAFMSTPFVPDLAGSSLAQENVALADPLAAKGKKLFGDNSCDGCHGDGGRGTAAGPTLIGVGAKYNHDVLTNLLKNPTAKMKDGNMDPVQLPDDQMELLLSYLNSLK